jgi:hypothetical protein
MSYYKHQALHAIYNQQGVSGVVENDNGLWELYDADGVKLDLDPDSVEVQEKAAELELANGYKVSREAAYPSIQEQLDMQYWDLVNGTTTWADSIAAVKTANPKPE